jgi:hypothetical protein
MKQRKIICLAVAFIVLLASCKKNQDTLSADEQAYKDKFVNQLHAQRGTKPANVKASLSFNTFKEAYQYFAERKRGKLVADTTFKMPYNGKGRIQNAPAARSNDDGVFVFYPSNFYSVTLGNICVSLTTAPLLNYTYSPSEGYGSVYQVVDMYIGDINYLYSGDGTCNPWDDPVIGSNTFEQLLEKLEWVYVQGTMYLIQSFVHVFGYATVYPDVPNMYTPPLYYSYSIIMSYN